MVDAESDWEFDSRGVGINWDLFPLNRRLEKNLRRSLADLSSRRDFLYIPQ